MFWKTNYAKLSLESLEAIYERRPKTRDEILPIIIANFDTETDPWTVHHSGFAIPQLRDKVVDRLILLGQPPQPGNRIHKDLANHAQQS